jgi:2'-5' RNA ligase
MLEASRLFIAIELPEELKKKLYDFEAELKNQDDKISWVAPQNIHLTLKFLGNVPQEKIDLIKKEMIVISSAFKVFSAVIKGVGLFPEDKKPYVVWVGVAEGLETLSKIYDILENRLMSLSFEKDERRYQPHFTLGRIKYIKNINNFSEKNKEA